MAEADSMDGSQGSVPTRISFWWPVQWLVACGIGGWFGSELASWWGWGLVALVTVGTLSLSESLRWWGLSRGERCYNPRFLLAMVVSYGIVGGLVLSVPTWLLALVVGELTVRIPRLGADPLFRCLAGAAIGAAMFALGRISLRRQQAAATQKSSDEPV